MKLRKNNSEANELRMVGNRHYKCCEFYEALLCYNKSLCRAVPGSVEFSLAFANRSAVYMELSEFEMCLENIELAIDVGYPDDKLEVLTARREKCLDMLELHEPDKHKNIWNFFKLSHPANEKIPFVIESIELRDSEKFGRHLITTRALKPGDVLCIEEPFNKFIVNSARFSHCANCLKSEKLNLFPCCECNYTMFCSKACMSVGQRFHQFECRVIDIDTDDESSIFQMTHRVVLEALGMFGKIAKLQKFLDDHPEPKTIFDFKLANEENLLLAVNSLRRNPIPDEMNPLMDRHVALMESITKNPQHKNFLREFMRKEMEIVITNTFGITGKNGDDVGTGIFPLASFFNHSCAPNVMRVAADNKLVFIASRPIDKHQQLFVCYRSIFSASPKPERQQQLLKSYRFTCSCEACTKNFPTLENLPSNDANFAVPSSPISSAESAKQEFQTNCDYISQHNESFPNFELCTLIERNQNLLESIVQLASFSQ